MGLTDTAIERFGFESAIDRKPVGGQGNFQQGRNQGNNQRRSNNQRRDNNQRRRDNQSRRDNNNQSRRDNNNQSRRDNNNQSRRDNNNQSRRDNNNQSRRDNNKSRRDNNNQSRRDNNQSRGRQGQNSKPKPKQDEDAEEKDTDVNNGEEQRKGSKKERQEKINLLFEFFKEHSEHSFTSAEIAPEFGITVRHLNSLLYELLRYGDVMKQFNNEEQQLVWYLADCHLETDAVEH